MGQSPFPTLRRSPDPMQPESPQIESGQEVADFDQQTRRAIQETEKTEQTPIKDSTEGSEGSGDRRHHTPRRAGSPEEETPDEDAAPPPDPDALIDIRV